MVKSMEISAGYHGEAICLEIHGKGVRHWAQPSGGGFILMGGESSLQKEFEQECGTVSSGS